MMPFEKCPICGGEVVGREVEKLLRGGVNTATVSVWPKSASSVENDCTIKRRSDVSSASGIDSNEMMSRVSIPWGSLIR